MTYYSTVTRKGQMTLPAEIRAKLHVKLGQRVAIRLNDHGEAVIEPVSDLLELRRKTYASLHERGISDEQVREMALGYRNGDGIETAMVEEYGQR